VARIGRRALPRQRFTDDAVEISVARRPVELLQDRPVAGPQHRWIARATPFQATLDRNVRNVVDRVEHRSAFDVAWV
jgi:hypothetical protein